MLQAFGILPEGMWVAIIPHLSFLLLLCFWQRVRALLLGPKNVFLDILCIPQDDDKLKARGIMGLGNNLECSQELTVLWSPRYFTRLWCTYEIAMFLRRPERLRKIHLVPVTMPVILCLFSAAWLCVRLQVTVVESVTIDWDLTGLRLLVRIGLMLLLVPVFVMQSYSGMGLVQDLEKLPKQLQEFSISDSQCSCCFFEHRHPKTGKRIMCDREVVYQAVSDSYDDQEVRRTYFHEFSRQTSGLDVFDGAVRSQLSDRISEQRLSSSLIPLDLFIYMVWAWDIPWLAPRLHLISQVGNLGRHPEYEHYDDLLRVLYALADMIHWAKTLPSILVLLLVSMRLWKLMSRWKCCPRIVRALASVPMVILSTLLVFLTISLAWDLTEDDWKCLNTLPFTFFLLLAICLSKPPKAKLLSFVWSFVQPGRDPSAKPSASEARSWSEQLDQSTEAHSSTAQDVHVDDEFCFSVVSV
ncbi:unnamed protein product [Symbiodinium sp. KB8]|nr:unnamed protein product [Symbiodinium sp. KB8]